jgi:hypothetical protein
MDDINKLIDAGNYKDALAAISRVTELIGAAAAPYDRQKVLMLKAECQIQLKQNSAANATLNLAKKEAKDPAAAAEPTALLELIQKSPGGTYTPKAPGAAPISVLDRAKRKDAYKALAADELALLQNQVKAASNAISLPPLMNIGRAAAPVRALELAATGKTDQVDAVTAQLAAIAQKLMNKALGDMSTKVESISAAANRQITVTVPMNFGRGQTAPVQQVRPVGLNSNDIQQLRDIEKTCDQFPPAVKELSAAFGDEKGFNEVSNRATQIKSRADTVLNANYEGSNIGGPYAPLGR